jgi:hypothetical protein
MDCIAVTLAHGDANYIIDSCRIIISSRCASMIAFFTPVHAFVIRVLAIHHDERGVGQVGRFVAESSNVASVLVSGMASALSQATFGDGARGHLCKLRIPCCGFQVEARFISAAHLFGVQSTILYTSCI